MSESEDDFVDIWQCGDCPSTTFQLTREGFVICRECSGRQPMQWRFTRWENDDE